MLALPEIKKVNANPAKLFLGYYPPRKRKAKK